MITTDRNISIYKGTSKIDETIVLYRGDYEVQIKFKITNNKFRFLHGTNVIESENAYYGQLAILTPYGGNIFSDICHCEDGAVTFTLTEEMINELSEIGYYSFQIRLFDGTMHSRATIPPIENGIEIREPIASEDHTDEMGEALSGYSIANIETEENAEVGETFDEEGNYNKTEWKSGMRISANRLNKIEDAIYVINQNEMNNTEMLTKQMLSNFNVLQAEMDIRLSELETEIGRLEEIIDEILVWLADSEGYYLTDVDGYNLINIII